jgi:DNA polymerase elongation subunit (family B)
VPVRDTRRITPAAIVKKARDRQKWSVARGFDKAYEARRKRDDDSEPGDDPKAPYYRQHQIATAVERLLAVELGVDWGAYDREVSSK